MKRVFFILAFLLAAQSSFAAPQTETILVLPFENRSASSAVGWISEAFAQELSRRLEGPGRLVLGRDERNAAYKQLGIPRDTTLTLASEYQVAETLGVDWMVTGSFAVSGQQLTAQAQLLDLRRLKLDPPVEETDALSNLIGVQTRLAWRLLVSYDPAFNGDSEDAFAARFPPVRLDAFENYIRGILATDATAKVHFLTGAERLDPADHRAAFALGQYYFAQKDYANSAQWLSRLAARDDDYLRSLFLSGVDNFLLGRDAEAERDFSTLSTEMPLSEVWNNLGVLEARGGDEKDALAHFERAHQMDPSDADYTFNLGACSVDLGQYPQAVRYLEAAKTESPDNLGVRTLLAYAMQKSGDEAQSRVELEWVSRHDGSAMADLSDQILPESRLKKQYNGAAFRLLSAAVHNSLEDVLNREPPEQHGRFHLLRGEDYIKQGRLPEAIRELSEAASLIPDNANVHFFLGQARELHGDHEKAVGQFDIALQINNSAVTHLWLAHAYLSLHELPEARAQGQAALTLEPGNADAQRLMNSIQQQQASTRSDP
ncbi:MAG: tetratricopeptide repeat protein [Terriglobia bacterium]